MYCKNCKIPVFNRPEGYYRIKSGAFLHSYYCRECYLNLKSKRESEYRAKSDAHRLIDQKIQLLEKRINNANYNIITRSNSIEHYYVPDNNVPYMIKEMIAEMNDLYNQNKNIRWMISDADFVGAQYFESKAAEIAFDNRQREEEQRKAEEEAQRKKAEEERRKKLAEEAELKRKAEEEERRKKAEEEKKARIIEEQKRKEREELEKKKRIFHENEQAVIDGKKSYKGRIITYQELLTLARSSQNMTVIKQLMRSKDIAILQELKKNPLITNKLRTNISDRIQKIRFIRDHGILDYLFEKHLFLFLTSFFMLVVGAGFLLYFMYWLLRYVIL